MRRLMGRFPRLEIVSSFGVGYDYVDAKWAGENHIVVTNTPDVLNDEVADTALGLLLCTVREFPQAERYLRAGKWRRANTARAPRCATAPSASSGMGRIGKAIARRLEACGCRWSTTPRRRPTSPTGTIGEPLDMARDVDILILITPGGPGRTTSSTPRCWRRSGPRGILINMSRGRWWTRPR